MLSYIIGAAAIIFQVLLFLAVGMAFRKDRKNYQINLITGYIIYSFFIVLIGISAQFLDLEWRFFAYGMAVVIFILIAYVVFTFRKTGIKLTKDFFVTYLKENYVLYITALLMTLICMLSYNAHWFGNHLDDGFYLNKVAIYPYINHPFRTNPSTGFLAEPNIAYILNTHEMEAAFFPYVLHIAPTLYTRVFLSCFHYFLMANVVQIYAVKLMKHMNVSGYETRAQFASIIMLLFVANPVFLFQTRISSFQDASFTVTAMWYGSSISRCFGMLLLLAPFLEEEKLLIKTVLSVVVISVVMISKSTVAATVIILSVLSYVFTLTIEKNRKAGWLLTAGFAAVSLLLYFLFGVQEKVEFTALSHLRTNLTHCCLLWIPLIGIGASYYWRNRFVNKVNLMILLYAAFMIVPGMNFFPATISSYIFVIARAFSGWMYCVYLTAFIYLLIWFSQKFNSMNWRKIGGAASVMLLAFDLITMKIAGGSFWPSTDGSFSGLSMKTHLAAIYRNPDFAPVTVIDLGETLKELEKETGEDLYIACQELINDYGATFALATQLKQFVPDAYVVSSTYRYGTPDYSEFETYTAEEQLHFEAFNDNADHQNTVAFGRVLDKYPINTVIMRSDAAKAQMDTFGFDLYRAVTNEYSDAKYYVYYRYE